MQSGWEPRPGSLPSGDVLPDLYGNVLVAPTSLISGNPSLVRRFNQTYVRSLAASLGDPQGTAEILHKPRSTPRPWWISPR